MAGGWESTEKKNNWEQKKFADQEFELVSLPQNSSKYLSGVLLSEFRVMVMADIYENKKKFVERQRRIFTNAFCVSENQILPDSAT